VTFLLATSWGSCTGYRYLTGQLVLTHRQATVATTATQTVCWRLSPNRTGASKLNSVLGANHNLCCVGAFIQTQLLLFTNRHGGFKFEFEWLTSTCALCGGFYPNSTSSTNLHGASNQNLGALSLTKINFPFWAPGAMPLAGYGPARGVGES
jgi:hypothetical protein